MRGCRSGIAHETTTSRRSSVDHGSGFWLHAGVCQGAGPSRNRVGPPSLARDTRPRGVFLRRFSLARAAGRLSHWRFSSTPAWCRSPAVIPSPYRPRSTRCSSLGFLAYRARPHRPHLTTRLASRARQPKNSLHYPVHGICSVTTQHRNRTGISQRASSGGDCRSATQRCVPRSSKWDDEGAACAGATVACSRTPCPRNRYDIIHSSFSLSLHFGHFWMAGG